MTDYFKSALKAGLSAKAATVYVALLEAGVALPPKAIILRTKLHRQYVYDALQELEDRRLVVKEGSGHRVKYHGATPDRLLQEAEKTRLDAQDGVRDLMKLYDRSPAGIVEIIRGREAAIEYDLRSLREADQGDFLEIIGGGGMHWVHMIGKDIEKEWSDLGREKNIKVRYVGTGEDVRYNLEESPLKNESRIIQGIGDIVTVVIRKDSVCFCIYEPEIIYVLVKNDAAVKSQRALFEVLWQAAK